LLLKQCNMGQGEPANPEDEHAQDDERRVVSGHLTDLHGISEFSMRVFLCCRCEPAIVLQFRLLALTGTQYAGRVAHRMLQHCADRGTRTVQPLRADAGRTHAAVGVKAADAGPDHGRARKRAQPADHVHDAAARKVDGAGAKEVVLVGAEARCPAGRRPHPCMRAAFRERGESHCAVNLTTLDARACALPPWRFGLVRRASQAPHAPQRVPRAKEGGARTVHDDGVVT
jgi:hypothetical protein